MDDTLKNPHCASARIRISPTVAADYQSRGVFPDLRPPRSEDVGRYVIEHTVSRALAQAVFDDAVEQAARGGTRERRSLTLAYNALARRTSMNFGKAWSPYNPGAARPDPDHFGEQAPIIDDLLRRLVGVG